MLIMRKNDLLRKNNAINMGEQNFYYKYPHPAVTADCVIFGFDGVSIKVLLIQRVLNLSKVNGRSPVAL